jgi:hypothetical protein
MGLGIMVAVVIVGILVVVALDLFGLGWALRKLWERRAQRRGRH